MGGAETTKIFLAHLLDLAMEASPWLLFGLLIAGLVKAWVPEERLGRLLGGRGMRAVITGALVGAPLPICSCGVLPAAIALHRGGASREAVTSFLVSTPETGVDSVALSYGILGPFMAVARPVAALFSAMVTGMAMTLLPAEATPPLKDGGKCRDSGCGGSCSSSDTDDSSRPERTGTFWSRTRSGVRYAFTDILDDFVGWLVVGLVLAAATMTWVPPQTLGALGSGIFAMVAMVLLGLPMYICATASTPVAASLLLAGMSPGAVMVFMLAGPATNIATIGVVRDLMGNRGAAVYVGGIVASSLVAGLATDAVVTEFGIDVAARISGDSEIIPRWLAMAATGLVILLAARPALLALLPAIRGRTSKG